MKVVVFGTGPWPTEPGAVVTSPAIRTRIFVEPLQAAKHDVVLILLEDQRRSKVPVPRALAAEAFAPDDILNPAALSAALDLSFTGAVFGVGSLMPNVAACRLAKHLGCPAWVDFNGDPLAELHAAQLRQGGKPDITTRDHIWKLTREALLSGDAFSTVSGPQRHAVLGQLGLLGRYVDHWDVCQRVSEIPNGVPPAWAEPIEVPPFPKVLSDAGFKPGDRYVLFTGSWNVWLDEATMGRALAIALEQEPSLKVVISGIPTGPAGQEVRRTFLEAIAPAVAAGRVLECPPLGADAENALLAHAGTCFSLDRAIPESELGARNRLHNMVRWGTRPVVSIEAEIERVIVAEGLAAGVEGADPQRAAREVLRACARSASEREEDRQNALQWMRTVTYARVMTPAIAWLAAGPKPWPAAPAGGLLDQWAGLPADPEILFPTAKKRRSWFS